MLHKIGTVAAYTTGLVFFCMGVALMLSFMFIMIEMLVCL